MLHINELVLLQGTVSIRHSVRDDRAIQTTFDRSSITYTDTGNTRSYTLLSTIHKACFM